MDIASLSDDNFSNYDFEACGPTADKSEITLDLSLEQKGNPFEADSTPTPTRLIKDCEAVGLFEDLRHVNPFDEGFRRAVEQNTSHNSAPTNSTLCTQNDGDSLHTPQVYPLDCAQATEYCGLSKTAENESPLDVPIVDGILTATTVTTPPTSTPTEILTIEQATASEPRQVIAPQIITWVIPAQVTPTSILTEQPPKTLCTAIPVQTVRPFILPKPANTTPTNSSKCAASSVAAKLSLPALNTHVPTVTHEPSSASLTPTSQLPIKERLKAILSNNKLRTFVDTAENSTVKVIGTQHKQHRDSDCKERRRAAASRYRDKMRNEHKELRQKNAELRTENNKLHQRIQELERELNKMRDTVNAANQTSSTNAGRAQAIELPQSSIHLVINVPKMIVPSNDGMPMLQQPITYQLQKK